MLCHCVLVSVGVWKALSHCSESDPTTTLPKTIFFPEKKTIKRKVSKSEQACCVDFQPLSSYYSNEAIRPPDNML
jgi:hypothetical protein